MSVVNTEVELGPLKLKNPILTASGTFGYGLEFSQFGDLASLGGVIVKGLSLKPRQGNPMPRIVETPCGMLNAIGLQNIGIDAFLKDKLPFLPFKDTAVIVNLYAHSVQEFGELAEILSQETRVAALEVNISCPNVKQGGVQFGQEPKMAFKVVEEVRKKAGPKPVIVKLSPNVTDIKEIARAVIDAGSDIVSLINTLSGMAVDIYTKKPKLKNIFGGLSGPAIKPVALKMVYEVASKFDIPVIGVGGISKVEDVLEFLLVGALAVQIGSANFMRPGLSFELVEELPHLMNKLGIVSLKEWVGSLEV
ncbi:dihydroorotate dehydrogenase (NAD+) catalytic subunit [Desulfonauticus submarinus]|uniref:Dihydroorotate dehydrogenase n=1 Tax=Desulfonauticus submarinus TaxID=206665 RepID=A0A1H0D6Z6_9BACT|nr:dihydroorotate dehydrogenase [Desulfonauticus submarinus]SDN65898.1 dihydroorotate dehydrogenase (NAD+) catalytic subunit [Desulfonauticus submarinus]